MPITSRSRPKSSSSRIVCFAADAAAQLAGTPDRLDDGADAGKIARSAVAGAVEIDQVEACGPQGHPVSRHGGRIFAEDGFPLVVPLLEADALPPRRSMAGQISTLVRAPVSTPGNEPKHVI